MDGTSNMYRIETGFCVNNLAKVMRNKLTASKVNSVKFQQSVRKFYGLIIMDACVLLNSNDRFSSVND